MISSTGGPSGAPFAVPAQFVAPPLSEAERVIYEMMREVRVLLDPDRLPVRRGIAIDVEEHGGIYTISIKR